MFQNVSFDTLCLLTKVTNERNFGVRGVFIYLLSRGKILGSEFPTRLIIMTFCLKRACIFVGWMVFWLSLAAETESVRTKPCHWSLAVKDKTIPACVMQIAREEGSQQLKCAFMTNSREKKTALPWNKSRMQSQLPSIKAIGRPRLEVCSAN